MYIAKLIFIYGVKNHLIHVVFAVKLTLVNTFRSVPPTEFLGQEVPF